MFAYMPEFRTENNDAFDATLLLKTWITGEKITRNFVLASKLFVY